MVLSSLVYGAGLELLEEKQTQLVEELPSRYLA